VGVEFGFRFEAVPFPELGDLGDDLLAVGVPSAPSDRGMETVHYGVDLETGGVVNSLIVRLVFDYFGKWEGMRD